MSIKDRYFKVTGGAVKQAYERWLEIRETQAAARDAFMKEFGGAGTYGNHRRLAGLVFLAGQKSPEGWHRVPGSDSAYAPKGSRKGFREIRARMDSLRLAGAEEFQNEVTGEKSALLFMAGLSIYYMSFEILGDNFVLKVPNVPDERWSPPDEHCVEIKTSEYWQLKEAAEAAAPEAAAA